jgi:hypothetical protein
VFHRDSGQLSERSDAGTLMVGQVIGFLRRNDPERTGGSGFPAGDGAEGQEGGRPFALSVPPESLERVSAPVWRL